MLTKKQLREKFNVWLGHKFDKKHKESKNVTHRWLFCWEGQDTDDFDCGCCCVNKEIKKCDCICHERIGQIVDFFWNNLK